MNPKGPDDGWMAAKAATTLGSPKCCQGRKGASSHASLVCCLSISTNRQPTVHAGGTRHRPSQKIMALLVPHTPIADSTHMINLACPWTTLTELSVAPLDCGSLSADVSCTTSPGHANFTRPEWCKNGGLIVAPKHHPVVSQSVQICNHHLQHVLTACEVKAFRGNQLSKN